MSYNIIEKFNNVWELFSKSTEKYADREFFFFKRAHANVETTYKEEYQRVRKVATLLLKIGLKKGDKLILYCPTSPYFVEIFYACALLGIIIVPIDMEAPVSMIDQIIAETKPAFGFYSKSKPLNEKLSNSEDIENLDKLIFGLEPLKTREYAKLINQDDLLEILYTSGTTGKPKGVLISNKNIVTNIYNVLLIFPIKEKLNMLQLLPLSHSYAQVLTSGITVLGGEIFFLPKVNATEIKNLLNSQYITALPVVPQFLYLIKDSVEAKFRKVKAKFILDLLQKLASTIKSTRFRRRLFSFIHKSLGGNLDLMISGGAPLIPEVFTWWENLGIDIYKGYGATETGPVLTFEDRDDPDPISIGKPIPHQMFKIENSEILTKGDHVSTGYYENPEANSKAFTKDGWYKTGDLGFMKDGKVYLQGRIKDMIVLSNGLNIYPIDIENEFNKVNGIKDTVVIGYDFGKGVEPFAVFLTEKNANEIEKIITEVNSRLSINQWIKSFVIWDEEDFPRTHTRKVKRNLVMDKIPFLLSDTKSTEVYTKQNKDEESLEEKIRTILAEVTKFPKYKIEHSSYLVTDLKLDSLGRADLVATISDRTGKAVNESSIDEKTTFLDLLKIVEKGQIFQKKEVKLNLIFTKKIFQIFREIFVYPYFRLALFPFFNFKIHRDKEFNDDQYLIISNHRSNIDAILVFLFMPKNLRYKAAIVIAGDIWDRGFHQIFRPILNILFPIFSIDRFRNASDSMDVSAELLNKGLSLVIFPEGEISYEPGHSNFKKGAARIIREFQLPLVEIKTKGLEVIGKKKIVPTTLRNKVEIFYIKKEINPFRSEEEINEELERDYDGF